MSEQQEPSPTLTPEREKCSHCSGRGGFWFLGDYGWDMAPCEDCYETGLAPRAMDRTEQRT